MKTNQIIAITIMIMQQLWLIATVFLFAHGSYWGIACLIMTWVNCILAIWAEKQK